MRVGNPGKDGLLLLIPSIFFYLQRQIAACPKRYHQLHQSRHTRQMTSSGRAWALNEDVTAHERIEQYNHRPKPVKPAKDPVFTALAWRAYHIPGYSWGEDLRQYFANNHPLLGICCHHPKHPIRTPMRLLNLFASVVFGLLLTNIIWLFFVLNDERDAENAVLTISLGDSQREGLNTTNTVPSSFKNDEIAITEGMVVLWTFGSAGHALFDNTVWYLSACLCCLPCHSQESLERFQKYGAIFMVFIAISVGAVASFVVVLRASLEDERDNVAELESAGISDDQVELLHFSDKSSFDFLLSYAIELALALVVYYPLVGTVLFSGILGCGKVPILGGRPFEVAQESKKHLGAKRGRDSERGTPMSDFTDRTSSSIRWSEW